MTGRTIGHESIRWLVLEGVAIIASILLAFGIDAWWDGHQQRAEERLLLESVRSELEDIRKFAGEDRSSALAIRESVLKLIGMSYGDEPPEGEDVFRILGDSTWRLTPEHYAAPVLTSAVDAGTISIVSNTELRLKLISWETRLSDIRYIIQLDTRELLERQFPAFGEKDLLLAGAARSPCVPGNPNQCSEIPIQIDVQDFPDATTIVSDVKLRGVLAQRLATLGDVIDFGLKGLQGDLAEIVRQVEEELDRH